MFLVFRMMLPVRLQKDGAGTICFGMAPTEDCAPGAGNVLQSRQRMFAGRQAVELATILARELSDMVQGNDDSFRGQGSRFIALDVRAEQAAEKPSKSGEDREKHPPGPEGRIDSIGLMARLKSCRCYSAPWFLLHCPLASSLARVFQQTVKSCPFKGHTAMIVFPQPV
jgi:hypothetical protein